MVHQETVNIELKPKAVDHGFYIVMYELEAQLGAEKLQSHSPIKGQDSQVKYSTTRWIFYSINFMHSFNTFVDNNNESSGH